MTVIKCYLIGGAPLSGKTTLSNLWAAKHQATQISTDSIREWMWRLTRAEDYPRLFARRGMEVEEFFRTYNDPKDVMQGQVEQGKDVEKGIEAFLGCDLTIERLVIEGIAVTPEFALRLQKDRPDIQFEATFLFDDNVERISKRIHERGLWGPKDTYPDYIKDKEVDWVVAYNKFYEAEAKKHNCTLLHIDSLDKQ